VTKLVVKKLMVVIYVLSMGSLCWAQSAPSLATASSFSVLGGQAVTCTDSVITGDVGISPTTTAFTNTRCTIAGGTPPATNAAAVQARTDFLSAYDALALVPCTTTISTAAFTGNLPALGPLAPGVYCFPAAVTFTNTTLTLDGSTNPNGIWIFKVGAALTGSGFQIVMTNGGQPCNVFWSVGAAVTLSTSTLPPLFQGNILAGNGIGGSITITSGSVIGRALANVAVTLTGTNIHGSCAVAAAAAAQASASCPVDSDEHDKRHDHEGHDKDDHDHNGHGHDGDGHDGDSSHKD
jgi:hypothetical protein